MLLALPDPDDFCLFPLHAPGVERLDIKWFTHHHEPETLTRRQVCCVRPPPPPSINCVLAPRPLRPFVFEIIGQIAESDCHLTADGYGSRTETPIASCWIEPRGDCVSRREWVESRHTIYRVLDSIHHPWDADVLVELEGNTPRIQLFYEAPEGMSLQNSLPVFDSHGGHSVPVSLADVPVGRATRFLFTIHHSSELSTSEPSESASEPVTTDNPYVVYAEIFAVMFLE